MNNDKVVSFTYREYADIHFTYDYCRGNANAARRRYMQPGRRIPSVRMFIRIHTRIAETGLLFQITELVADTWKEEIENNPQTRARKVASQVGLPTTIIVNQIVKEDGLHPLHYQKVQALESEVH